MADFVAPYLYLVAISGKNDQDILLQASRIPAPHHDWYGYIADALIKTFRVTSVGDLTIPDRAISPIALRSQIPSSITEYDLNGR